MQGGNKGSVSNLVDYLEKENVGKNMFVEGHEDFFNHDGHHDAAQVERRIDSNLGKLSKDETKFYMLTVNPSKAELDHLKNKMNDTRHQTKEGHSYVGISDEQLFKGYINDLMDKYAENFNRNYPDGKPLSGKDLVYFAKIEHERTYKFGEKRFTPQMDHNRKIELEIANIKKGISAFEDSKEKQILNTRAKELEGKYIRNENGTIIKEGNLKDGNNLHAHIIVSRMDKTQTMKLSPMANHKNSKNVVNGKDVQIGFNRDGFVASGEKLFDKKFEYQRSFESSYNFYKETKQIRSVGNLLHMTNPKAFAKAAAKRALKEMITDKTLQKQLGYVTKDPRQMPRKMMNKLENKAIESVVKAMGVGAYSNPVTAGVQVAKQAITIAAKTVSKGMGI